MNSMDKFQQMQCALQTQSAQQHEHWPIVKREYHQACGAACPLRLGELIYWPERLQKCLLTIV